MKDASEARRGSRRPIIASLNVFKGFNTIMMMNFYSFLDASNQHHFYISQSYSFVYCAYTPDTLSSRK